ncbi:hypothetical protein V6N00_12665 [Tersicoccus sp. MR15.9]|uniref:hypothetical protein n=1 Tax=Tersicoccus mangrovi TaxID=3121635 RepID=UPI002FE5139E
MVATFTATQPRELARALKAALVVAGARGTMDRVRFVLLTVADGTVSVAGTDTFLLVHADGGDTTVDGRKEVPAFALPVAEARRLVELIGTIDPVVFALRDGGREVHVDVGDRTVDLETVEEYRFIPVQVLLRMEETARTAHVLQDGVLAAPTTIAGPLRRITALRSRVGELTVRRVEHGVLNPHVFEHRGPKQEDPWVTGLYVTTQKQPFAPINA